MNLNIKIFLGFLCIVFLSFVYANIPHKNEIIQTPKIVHYNPGLVIQQNVFLKDLEKQKHLSQEDKQKIAILVPKYAKKYELDSAILYSVLWKESRFRHTIEHNETFVKALKTKVSAIGIGGIVYEFWGSKLEKAGIIKVKEDLYKLENGIEASAFVLSELRKLKPLENMTLDESMLSRYYGKPSSYNSKVLSKANQIKAKAIDMIF